MDDHLPAGTYEALRTVGLNRALAKVSDLTPHFGDLAETQRSSALARHVSAAVQAALESAKPDEQVRLVADVLRVLKAADELPTDPLEQLLALSRQEAPGVYRVIRPETPLSESALLTNAPGEPNLGNELRKELASADRVDLLCAFVKWTGLRILETVLRDLRAQGIPLRVITTTYVGATERAALDRLVRDFNAEVCVSYETMSTRLHAKAWLFRRKSGFDTAFVGSSNLSKAALVDGLEWNVRLSGVVTPGLLRKFEATFDTYWASAAFERYDPDADADRLDDALARSRAGGVRAGGAISLSGLAVTPFPHQVSTLEALEAERLIHDRHRNLVVAATGTGKTVMAALDYKQLKTRFREDLSVLFVAHRKEILDQSLRTYREVLADGSFGESYVAGSRPERWRHVFASVQSLASYGITNIQREHFDVVVVDEFHHAAAPTYAALMEHLQPREFLGLTATPERSDGRNVQDLFGGRIAYELRLWDALEADLLVPFHYFGVADDVDLQGVEWKRGAYDVAGLDKLYTGNDARAAKVLRELRDKVLDVGEMRALGFCVSVAHAEYMARVFTAAGLPSLAVSGETALDRRAEAIASLRRGEVRCLFAADLFNEGLDIPEVDTVLLLRPTQSATVFLQQLGRGLRRADGKSVLTVLDLIGQQRKEFRFDLRYRALTGLSRTALENQIGEGFPYLAAGSQLILDAVAQRTVLENVRGQLRLTSKALQQDLRSHGDQSLASYLRESGRELADIYRGQHSWTDLRRSVGFSTHAGGSKESALLRRLSAFTHVDDGDRVAAYRDLVSSDGPAYDELNEEMQTFARMLFFTMWPNAGGFHSYEEGMLTLRQHPAVCSELVELMALTSDSGRHLPLRMESVTSQSALRSHAHYRREEILAGIDWASLGRTARGNITGVAWSPESRTDALLVNLRKSEATFSPSTMYRDFAISPSLFHWESQNATSTRSDAGDRELSSASSTAPGQRERSVSVRLPGPHPRSTTRRGDSAPMRATSSKNGRPRWSAKCRYCSGSHMAASQVAVRPYCNSTNVRLGLHR